MHREPLTFAYALILVSEVESALARYLECYDIESGEERPVPTEKPATSTPTDNNQTPLPSTSTPGAAEIGHQEVEKQPVAISAASQTPPDQTSTIQSKFLPYWKVSWHGLKRPAHCVCVCVCVDSAW